MKIINERIGTNYIYQQVEGEDFVSNEKVLESWNNSFLYTKEDKERGIKGLRKPQLGALFSIKSYWSIEEKPVTIVMPTGTGKTETMISTIVSEQCKKVLIIVPSDLLREQLCSKCITLGILEELGVIRTNTYKPVVCCLKKIPHDLDELENMLDRTNIVISTMKLISSLPEEYLDRLSEKCSNLMIDEAHHIAAKTWNRVKVKFKEKKILQFTATPFRNDEKKIDGKIIYNFPLRLAQEEGYFKPINFNPILEFDDKKSDYEIAKKAVEQLEKDIRNGYKHTILVRGKTIKRAEELFENIYSKKYKKYKPVLITSKLTNKEKQQAIESVRNNESHILVCVDMFGEGIDIPNLKIAAIHDKYKSLPITLQFIGRFARAKSELGDATVIANIAQDDVKEELTKLYAQDSDWNFLLHTLSSNAIGKETTLQDFIEGFDKSEINDINLNQIIPKVSMIPYKVDGDEWNYENWINVFDEQKCRISVNKEKNVLIIIEMKEESVKWTNNKSINDICWDLHIVYWNKSKRVAFINSTNKGICNRLMEQLFKKATRIKGEDIFKCLFGIKRLMLATVGLNTAINGPIRYKMFAGVDIAEGISEAQKGNCTKSNLFGTGYEGNGRMSIGCSYKGTIWAKWVETIDFWINWCDKVADKILDSNIDTNQIFKGVLKPRIINKRPLLVPISIEYPMELDFNSDYGIYISTPLKEIPLYETELRIKNITEINKPITFSLIAEDINVDYQLIFEKDDFYFKCLNKNVIEICLGRKKWKLTEYFKENPPRIKFVNQSTLEGNLYVELKDESNLKIDKEDIEQWDWNGINIKKESQTMKKYKDSIQYRVIQKLKDTQKYDIIFDDDGAGEIADVVAIRDTPNKIYFEYYHCKYSQENEPGARIKDLYEVCGQAQKSVDWKQNGIAIVEKMIKREKKRISNSNISKIELGSLKKLYEIQKKLTMIDCELEIAIVQPGVNSKKITESMNQILVSTKSYLKDTYNVKLKMIFS